MGIEELTQLEIIVGVFDTIFVIVSLLTGLKMLSKYIKLKQKTLLTAALTWIFLSGAWWSGSLSFILFILFNEPLNQALYLLLNTATPPIALICWIYTLSLVLYTNRRKVILAVFFTICIIYEILTIIFIFTAPDIVGTFSGTYRLTAQPFTIIFQLFAVLTTLITGTQFARESLKSDKPKIRWKGRFLLIAFISFTISLLEGPYASIVGEELTLFTLIGFAIFRFFLISSGIEYYFGYFFPEKLEKWLIKEE